MKNILCILFSFWGITSFCQLRGNLETRPVIISFEDSIIYINIITQQIKITPKSELWYYWYFSDQVNANKGGYHGNMLHGTYTVFDKEKHMITQGQFNKGLKNGLWRSWYPDGNKKNTVFWKDGLLDGKAVYFNPDGTVYMSIEYRYGKRNGEQVFFIGDSLVRHIYRNDIRIDTMNRPFKNIRLL